MGARPAASYARGLIWTGKRAKKKPPKFGGFYVTVPEKLL